MFCLNAAAANPSADPALRAGATPRFEETPIAAALARSLRQTSCSIRRAGCSSLLVDVKSHRGHELGSIGLVIGPISPSAAGRGDSRCAIIERFRAPL